MNFSPHFFVIFLFRTQNLFFQFFQFLKSLGFQFLYMLFQCFVNRSGNLFTDE